MAGPTGVAPRLVPLLQRWLGAELPVAIRGWDGSRVGPPDAPVLVLKSRRALRRLLWQPGELGLARAWVAGEIDVEGDLYEALGLLAGLVARRNPRLMRLSPQDRRELLRTAVVLGAVGPQPRPPAEEVGHLQGERHSRHRDRAAIRHHYDVGNEFYRIVLGPSLVYSCAYWTRDAPGYGLDEAQRDKLELICRKLDLRPGQRLLDVGCGWGSLVLHAAEHHGVDAVGVTVSKEQAELATKRIADAGLTGRVEIRLQDYREVSDGPYDAIASVGMAEHVGTSHYREYARHLYGLLRPEGRLLNHQIARRPGERRPSAFIASYVFPDGELSPLGTTVSLLERSGFEVRDVESLREHYGRTLRAWGDRLTDGWNRAVELAGTGRARVWRLYMAASALAFERGDIGVNQVLAVRPGPGGASGMPPVRPVPLGA